MNQVTIKAVITKCLTHVEEVVVDMMELVAMVVVEDAVVVIGVVGEAAVPGGPRIEVLEIALPTLLVADEAALPAWLAADDTELPAALPKALVTDDAMTFRADAADEALLSALWIADVAALAIEPRLLTAQTGQTQRMEHEGMDH